MQAFTNSCTRGASNAQYVGSAAATTGPQARVVTPIPTRTSEASPTGWMQKVSDQLREIAQLKPNWDSYDAEAPSPLAIVIALELLLLVEKRLGTLDGEQSQPMVVAPRADGGIQIEWGTYPVEIVVHTEPSGDLGYLYVDRKNSIYREVSSTSFQEVLQSIAKVVFTVLR